MEPKTGPFVVQPTALRGEASRRRPCFNVFISECGRHLGCSAGLWPMITWQLTILSRTRCKLSPVITGRVFHHHCPSSDSVFDKLRNLLLAATHHASCTYIPRDWLSRSSMSLLLTQSYIWILDWWIPRVEFEFSGSLYKITIIGIFFYRICDPITFGGVLHVTSKGDISISSIMSEEYVPISYSSYWRISFREPMAILQIIIRRTLFKTAYFTFDKNRFFIYTKKLL